MDARADQSPDPNATHAARRGESSSWKRYIGHAVVVGLLASVLVHVLGGWAASLLRFYDDASLGPGSAERVVEFAVATDLELAELTEASDPLSEQVSVPEVVLPQETVEPVEADAPVDELFDELATDLDLFSTDPSAASPGSSGSDGQIGDFGTGSGGAGGGTSFFGVEARGRRFAFVVDQSGSMRGDRQHLLKIELTEAIRALQPDAQFYVVLYASNATRMADTSGWIDATEEGKDWALRTIRRLGDPAGGTNPLSASPFIDGLRPRPDAIYLMTDGQFGDFGGSSPEQVERAYIALGREARCPVHCIALGRSADTATMSRIASRTGGTFAVVEGGP
ncbi:MAG: VWA domain-containing protein [Planctomycetota bacterium]